MAGIFGMIKGMLGKNKQHGGGETSMDRWRSLTNNSSIQPMGRGNSGPDQDPHMQALDEMSQGYTMPEEDPYSRPMGRAPRRY